MQCFILSCWSVLLLCQTVQGLQFGHVLGGEDLFNENLDSLPRYLETSTSKTSSDPLKYNNGSFEPDNSTSEIPEHAGSESSLLNENSARTEQIIIPSPNVNQLQATETSSTRLKALASTSEIRKSETSTQASSNESLFNSTEISSIESSTIVKGDAQSSNKTTLIFVTPDSVTNQSISTDDEPEGVIIFEPFSSENGTTTAPHESEKSIYQKALEIVNDAYTLSIVVPIAAGILFATTIIVTIATCRCLRRRCRRRRIRRNAKLPDSVKSLRPSDSARLLAESSDEEF